MLIVAVLAGLVGLACLVIHYENEYADLAEWADSLSEEMAELYETHPELRGTRWLS